MRTTKVRIFFKKKGKVLKLIKNTLVVQNIQNFTNSTLSSFYFDTIKDRLYNESQSSESRRMAQTVLYEVKKKPHFSLLAK